MASNRETHIQNGAMLAVGQRDDVMVWRQPVGVLRAYDDPTRVIKVGTPGAADSMMVVAVKITPDMVGRTVGVAVGAEFKTETGRQRENQKRWQAALEKRGGVYALVRTPAEMVELVERVKRGDF